MPSETPILAVRELTKTFGGVHALNNVSFSLMRGSITAVIGPNGSGKTTLVNCITGNYRADSGTILLGGGEIGSLGSDEIAARGKMIYEEQLRDKVEPDHLGNFIVIDIDTGDYEIDADDLAASLRAYEKKPDGARYGMRIGRIDPGPTSDGGHRLLWLPDVAARSDSHASATVRGDTDLSCR